MTVSTHWCSFIVLFSVIVYHFHVSYAQCQDPCRVVLTESIPENVTFKDGSIKCPSHFDSWKNLLNIAEESIDIGSFYWSLRGNDTGKVFPSSDQGQDIYDGFMKAGTERGIDIRIAVSKGKDPKKDDTWDLSAKGAADVRWLDFDRLEKSGVLHTKMWIVDKKHIYIGSANFDWRSLTQVKELGAVIYNCSCMAEDLQKIFDVYWYLGNPDAKVPDHWPSDFDTKFNMENPMEVYYNNTYSRSYLSSSPPDFCPDGRTGDIDAILDVMDKAQKFINIAVMEYLPTTLYHKPRIYWPRIDDKMRSMSFDRKVHVRLMIGYWDHSPSDMMGFLRSLQALNSTYEAPLEVKLFKVPSTAQQAEIPFARVNHDKYMVTDNTAYIGTSNWIGDYFISTGGVGLIVNQTTTSGDNKPYKTQGKNGITLQQQLLQVFERDWNSEYAHWLDSSPHQSE